MFSDNYNRKSLENFKQENENFLSKEMKILTLVGRDSRKIVETGRPFRELFK